MRTLLLLLLLLLPTTSFAAGEFDHTGLHEEEVAALVTKSGGRAVVVGPNAESLVVARQLAGRLRARGLVILGDDAIATTETSDKGLVKASKELPVDVVVVVRVYAGGSAPDTLTLVVYDKKQKAKLTTTGSAAMTATPGDKTPKEEAKKEPEKKQEKAQKQTVVVIDPASADLDAGKKKLVSQVFTHGLSGVERFSVTSSEDVARMLEVEANRQLTGCSSEECLAEIGDALGAERALGWSVSRADDVVAVDFSFFDTKTGVALARGNAKAKEADLLDEVERAFASMLRELLRKEGSGDPVAAARARFRDEQLTVDERRTPASPFIPIPVALLGKQEVPIEWADFYARAGRDDLADDARFRDGVLYYFAYPSLIGGTLVVIGGVTVGGILQSSKPLGSRDETGTIMMGATAGIGIGIVVAGLVGAIVAADSMPVEEKRRIADEHNELLRQKLSLPSE